jgi:hypothetical protein
MRAQTLDSHDVCASQESSRAGLEIRSLAALVPHLAVGGVRADGLAARCARWCLVLGPEWQSGTGNGTALQDVAWAGLLFLFCRVHVPI